MFSVSEKRWDYYCTCTITGARQYSSDLPQGGLEIPSCLTFSASKEISKIKKLLPLVPPDYGGTATIAANIKASNSSSIATGPLLNIKPNPDEDYCDLTIKLPPIKKCRTSNSALVDTVWLKLEKITLSVFDKEALCNGSELNDRLINYCQGVLKKQFPLIGGFILTFLRIAPSRTRFPVGYKSFIVSKGTIGLLRLGVSHVTTQLEYMTPFIKQ